MALWLDVMHAVTHVEEHEGVLVARLYDALDAMHTSVRPCLQVHKLLPQHSQFRGVTA